MSAWWTIVGGDAYVVSEMTPDHLLITAPGSALGWPWLYIFFFVLFVVITYATSRSVRRAERPLIAREKLDAYVRRYRVTMIGGSFFGLVVFWLVAYSGGSIELDRRTNLATMHAKFTAFLPAETGSMPLSAVDQAILDHQPNARRIRLISKSGADLAFPLWTGRAGQVEAARAINRFLACAGCDAHGEAERPAGNTKGGISLLRFADGKVAEDWSRNIRACRHNAGATDFSFGTESGRPILTINGKNRTVLLNGPHGAVIFNQQECKSLELEVRPATSTASKALPGTEEVDGRIDLICKSDAGELNGAVYFEHCGR